MDVAPLIRWLRARPADVLLGAIVVGVSAYVVVYPFLVAKLPLITDLPFHATAISILRHYWDPSFHFQEQFTLHPIEVPYISMYVLGALFALFMPAVAATKASTIVMLALLPIGLAVFFHGMKKTPLWGLLGLVPVWMNLTWWGFINHVGALGLYAMSIGFALMCVDRPTRGRSWGLALSLLAVFFTHVFRYPFALLSVIGAALLVYPSTRRLRPILLPLVPSLVVFGAWYFVRPQGDMPLPNEPLRVQPERLREAWSHVIQNFYGPDGAREQLLFDDLKNAIFVVALTAVIWRLAIRHKDRHTARELWWEFAVILLPLVLAGGFLLAYLILPMRIGIWWYVYPRELTSALFIGLAAVPDMPRVWWLRLPLVAILALFIGKIGYFAASQFWQFDRQTADFRRVARQVSPAPKLLYLVFDHGGSSRRVTPFIHLPAWVQAEKGGALSFQFIGWKNSPIRYRDDPARVPPPVPDRWEWTPERYRHAQHGAWFNEFLIRSPRDPAYLFANDPSIVPVAHDGTWWLYRRK
jgi:hypothetical protein